MPAGLDVAAEADSGEAFDAAVADVAAADVAELAFFAVLVVELAGVEAGGSVADFAALVACEAGGACCSAGFGGDFGAGLAGGAPLPLLSMEPELLLWLAEVELGDVEEEDDEVEADQEEEEEEEEEEDDDEDAEPDELDFPLGGDAGVDSVGDADQTLGSVSIGAKTTRTATSVARLVYVAWRARLWVHGEWSRARISPPSIAPKRC